jgi:hypothetical protein
LKERYKNVKQQAEMSKLALQASAKTQQNAAQFNELKALENGKVAKILKKKGDFIRKGDAIAQMANMNTLVAKLNLDENSIEKVKIGQKLQAFSINTTGLRMKLNNTTEASDKAKSCVQIRSSFTISENSLANAGTKTVYMQIIDPDGKTLQAKSSNTVQLEQGTIAYSDKKEIDYNNQSIDLSIYYDLKNKEAIKGNYKVKIYCDGLLIGSDSFSLK